MTNLMVTAAAKRACNDLVFIAEKTDEKEVSEVCIETIKIICRNFNITTFGSLLENRNSSMPRSASVVIGDGFSSDV